jgi:hypothetical protein
MVEDDGYARLVILNYWRNRQPEAFRNLDVEVLVRTHNGGVGYDSATDLYWERYQLIDSGLTWWGTKVPENIFDKY